MKKVEERFLIRRELRSSFLSSKSLAGDGNPVVYIKTSIFTKSNYLYSTITVCFVNTEDMYKFGFYEVASDILGLRDLKGR